MVQLMSIDDLIYTLLGGRSKIQQGVVSKNALNARRSLKPYHWLMSIFGMRKFNYAHDGQSLTPTGWLNKFVATLWFGLIASACCYSVYDVINRDDYTPVILIIFVLCFAFSASAGIIGVVKSAFDNSTRMIQIVENVREVDEQLNLVNDRFYSIYRFKLCAFIVLFVGVNAAYFIYEQLALNLTPRKNVRLVCEHLARLVTNVQFFDYAMVLWTNAVRARVLVDRFEAFLAEFPDEYQHLSPLKNLKTEFKHVKLTGIEAKLVKWRSGNSVSQRRTNEILFVMKIFDTITDNVQLVNECYGLPLLIASVTCFFYTMLTINGLLKYNTFNTIDGNYTQCTMALWCIFLVLFLTLSTYASELLISEIDRTGLIIDKLNINPVVDVNQMELLECLTNMLSGKNVSLTAYNFFAFDFSFVFSLLGTIATYTVILMQVPETPKDKPS